MSEIPFREFSRRSFLQGLVGVGALVATGGAARSAPSETRNGVRSSAEPGIGEGRQPWYRRTYRWGQTNLAEIDAQRFDIVWWRGYWKRTAVQGVVVNAGGIVAYYPTEVPFHRRARFLGERDLFGEIVHAAHEDGLAVFARMDSNRADETFYRAHPDWFAHDADGQPYKSTDLYIACVNSPYYDEHIPAILREVAMRYHPDGFTDNNWNGPMRHQPCFCPHCQRKFRARAGSDVPRRADWNDPVYREWIGWNYERRLEIWDAFNRITRSAGGSDCIWVGMMAGSQNWQARVFRDDREIYRRAELIMLDHQRRSDNEGFQSNAETGRRLHCVGGWDKVIPESMATYQAAEHNLRLAAKPSAEVRLWAEEAFAGGIQPWWHHVGSDQQDRRVFEVPLSLWPWHRDSEVFLVNRRPVASVGLVWSQRNMNFFGRDDAGTLVDDPWNGFTQALVRSRIPYVPVHVDDVERVADELGLRLLILPNLGAMSEEQIAGVRRFVEKGGALFATGASSLCDLTGTPRRDFGLADVVGVHLPEGHYLRDERRRLAAARDWSQTYLRVSPELRGGIDGPRSGNEPGPATSDRHPVLHGLEKTDIVGFGGALEPIVVDPGASVPLTFVPPVPNMPVESVWMPTPTTEIPALVLRENGAGARIAYLAADLDRRFARDFLPDHGALLANIVCWALGDELPLVVTGPGLIDCQLYEQGGRFILHLVNLTNPAAWRSPANELIPTGPFRIEIRGQSIHGASGARSLVTGKELKPLEAGAGRAAWQLDSILDHEVVVVR
ncbi:Tat pathway signal protein [Opitutaceae bacterium EW11]|nr:Tat pathway signal protein [Opitutaceae bacterium EW11]